MTYVIVARVKATNCDLPFDKFITAGFAEDPVKKLLDTLRQVKPDWEFKAKEAYIEPKLMPW